jgi:hypothetical protein
MLRQPSTGRMRDAHPGFYTSDECNSVALRWRLGYTGSLASLDLREEVKVFNVVDRGTGNWCFVILTQWKLRI